jgi:hypothetical protein
MKNAMSTVSLLVMLFAYQICNSTVFGAHQKIPQLTLLPTLARASTVPSLGGRELVTEIDGRDGRRVTDICSAAVTQETTKKIMVNQEQVKILQGHFIALYQKFKSLPRSEACKQLPDGIKDAMDLCRAYQAAGLECGFEAGSRNKIQETEQSLKGLLTMILHPKHPMPDPIVEDFKKLGPPKPRKVIDKDKSVCIHVQIPRNSRGDCQSPRTSPRTPETPWSPISPSSSSSPEDYGISRSSIIARIPTFSSQVSQVLIRSEEERALSESQEKS